MPDSQSDDRPICDYEGSTYRTDFWEGRGREYEDAAERVAIRAMLPKSGRRVVDIGAGFGRLADLYAGYGEVVLLDYSRSQLEYAREQLGDERFIYVAADIYRLPLATNACDAAVMVRVMHHLADVPTALAQVARALAPQGSLVLEHANKRHLKNIVRWALRRGVNPFDPAPYAFQELHYDFHPAWVRERLAEVDLPVQEVRAVSMLRSSWLKQNLPIAWLVWLDALLQRPCAGIAPAPSVFVRCEARKPGASAIPPREALFCCPTCGAEPLVRQSDAWLCRTCSAEWPIVNGIHLFK